ncbi:MAG TPA: pectinesterase family protein [Hanamia sp.]|nr:pectinesterase family protein [Hanamia sp.]
MLVFYKILFGCWMALLSATNTHQKPAAKYDYVVAKDGSGDFTTIQAAIEASKAFPYDRIRIFIKNGVYHEKVFIPSWNTKISLIGESKDSTIISYGDYFKKIDKGRNSTFYTSTLLVQGNDFHAENLTVENTAGPVGQAVALSLEADRCSFTNCKFLGNQDTLYLAGENDRQYFVDCYIEGTTDFIFGEATALFEKCTIRCKADSYITAASTPQGVAYGFVFKDCTIEAAPGINNVFLGRPWRKYAKVVFINSKMGSFINPEGWSNWQNTDNYKTVFYAEKNSTGAGSNKNKRVSWSHQLTEKDAEKYSLKNIFSGLDNWNPLNQNNL